MQVLKEQPIPDFEKLFREADSKRAQAAKTAKQAFKHYDKLWLNCGKNIKAYWAAVEKEEARD